MPCCGPSFIIISCGFILLARFELEKKNNGLISVCCTSQYCHNPYVNIWSFLTSLLPLPVHAEEQGPTQLKYVRGRGERSEGMKTRRDGQSTLLSSPCAPSDQAPGK